MNAKYYWLAVWGVFLLGCVPLSSASAFDSIHSVKATRSAASSLVERMSVATNYEEYPRLSDPHFTELFDAVWGIALSELSKNTSEDIREYCVVGKVIFKGYLNYASKSGDINVDENFKAFSAEILKGLSFSLNCLAAYVEAGSGNKVTENDSSIESEAAGWFSSDENAATQLLISSIVLATSDKLNTGGSNELSATIKSAGLRLMKIPRVIQKTELSQSLKVILAGSIRDSDRANLSALAAEVGL